MLAGCVQPSMMPNINSATARVLDAAGIQTLVAPRGRLLRRRQVPPERPGRRPGADARQHRRLVAATCERGEVEAIVMNASGCGVTVREYGHLLQHDPAYAHKARAHQRAHARPERAAARAGAGAAGKVRAAQGVLAFHPPCTLQHGQKLRGGVESHCASWASTCGWR